MTTVEAHALAATIEARIAVLWAQRQRDKRHAYHTPARHDRDTELRALVRLARSARRLARRTETLDPITAAKASNDQRLYPDWAAWQAAGPR